MQASADLGIASLNMTMVRMMTVEEYAAAIDQVARSRRLIGPDERYYPDPDVWADMLDDGLTPEEALDEEMAAVATLM